MSTPAAYTYPPPAARTAPEVPGFMSVREVAGYLHLNEKKIYALVREGRIPATKVTGKWVFPRVLVDRWLLESSHGGMLTDRLIISGSEDPLLHHVVLGIAAEVDTRALLSYSPTGTRLGLGLLAALRADVGLVHWGPAEESRLRHPALLQQHNGHANWILVRAGLRQQGLILRADTQARFGDVEAVLDAPLRWVKRPPGSGSQRFLLELLARHQRREEELDGALSAHSDRQAASLVARGEADVAAGARASAGEFGLAFLETGWEALDFALPRSVYFRALFQKLLQALSGAEARLPAKRLGGYDLRSSGELIWGME